MVTRKRRIYAGFLMDFTDLNLYFNLQILFSFCVNPSFRAPSGQIAKLRVPFTSLERKCLEYVQRFKTLATIPTIFVSR